MSLTNRQTNDFHNGANNPSYVLDQIVANKYDLKDAVKLPIREDRREWIANNIFDFHKQICMLYGTINEFCTAMSCPKMTAGTKYEYLWSFGPKRAPVDCCASEYIHHLLDWVQEQLDDEEVFPSTSVDKEFPPDYEDTCRAISKRLFRVYAHIYHHHLHDVRRLQEEAHMNTSLKHYIYFVQEFGLVSEKDLDPLKEYIQNLT